MGTATGVGPPSPEKPKMRTSSPPMSTAQAAYANPMRSTPKEALLRALLVGAGLVLALGLILVLGRGARPHAPDLKLLAAQRPVILIHVFAALAALGIGAALMAGRKGILPHRLFGWIWVVAMLATTISSFLFPLFARTGFSPIHGLSAWVSFSAPMGIVMARRGQIAAHRKTMTGIFLFGMIVAGAFTFLPGRLMWRLFFG